MKSYLHLSWLDPGTRCLLARPVARPRPRVHSTPKSGLS